MKPQRLKFLIIVAALIEGSVTFAGPGVGGIRPGAGNNRPGLGGILAGVVRRVTVGRPQMIGAGCPEGTAQAVVSPEGDTVSILFSRFEISKQPDQQAAVLRTGCRVNVPFVIPDGQRLQAFQVDYRGYLHLEDTRSRFVFDSTPTIPNDPRGSGRTQETIIPAPFDGPLLFSHNLGPIRFSQCGGTANIDLNLLMAITGVGVKGAPLIQGSALSTIDSADAAIASQDNGLHIRVGLVPCN